jgi:hypothetical protein
MSSARIINRRLRGRTLRSCCALFLSIAAVAPRALAESQVESSGCSEEKDLLAVSRNIYRSTPGTLRMSIVCGRSSGPSRDLRPIVFLEKVSGASKGPSGHWDLGAAYFQLLQQHGDVNGAAVTASVLHDKGRGDLVGIHGRATALDESAKLWGGWFYVDTWKPFRAITGVEINVRNHGQESAWGRSGFPPGTATGLIVAMADHSRFPGTNALNIAAQAGARGWHTGILMPRNSIEPADPAGNGEALRVHGADSDERAFKLLRAREGSFVSGIETMEASFSRGVFEMANGQYLAWGGSPAQSGASRLTVTDKRVLSFSGNGIRLRPINAPPAHPDEGTIVFADGELWNPGAGRGFYGFENGKWRKL